MDYLILALATWRLTNLIVGPLEVFARFRVIAGVQENDYGRFGTTELARMLACFWCASIWVALCVYILYLFAPVEIFIPFALSGAAIVISELND
jgi:hypothetical protein